MKTVNALTVRQSLGRVLDQLEKTGEPIIVAKDRKARAVLITLADFERRFDDVAARDRRREIARQIKESQRQVPRAKTGAAEAVRSLRGRLP